jgi:hypothetical protein
MRVGRGQLQRYRGRAAGVHHHTLWYTRDMLLCDNITVRSDDNFAPKCGAPRTVHI